MTVKDNTTRKSSPIGVEKARSYTNGNRMITPSVKRSKTDIGWLESKSSIVKDDMNAYSTSNLNKFDIDMENKSETETPLPFKKRFKLNESSISQTFPVLTKTKNVFNVIKTEPNNSYKCDRCPIEYKFKKRLDRHIYYQHDNPNLVICNVCELAFSAPDRLLVHLKWKHPNPVSKKELLLPVKQKSKIKENSKPSPQKQKIQKIFQCQKCKTFFAYKASLETHLQFVHEHRKFGLCPSCNNNFRKPSTIWKHLRNSHDKLKLDAYQCTYCKKRFPTPGLKSYHVQKEHKIYKGKSRNFVCNICGASYISKTSLLTHMMANHLNLDDDDVKMFEG